MAVTHGNTSVLALCATYNGSYVAADGVDTASLNAEYNLLETTCFSDTNVKTRICGLKDWTLDLSGFYQVDATGQGLVRSLGQTSAQIWFTLKYDGTNGYGVIAQSVGPLVANWKVDTSVQDAVKFSGQLMCNGGMITEVGTAD